MEALNLIPSHPHNTTDEFILNDEEDLLAFPI